MPKLQVGVSLDQSAQISQTSELGLIRSDRSGRMSREGSQDEQIQPVKMTTQRWFDFFPLLPRPAADSLIRLFVIGWSLLTRAFPCWMNDNQKNALPWGSFSKESQELGTRRCQRGRTIALMAAVLLLFMAHIRLMWKTGWRPRGCLKQL